MKWWNRSDRPLGRVVEELTARHASRDGQRRTLAYALVRDELGELLLWQAVKLEAKTSVFAPDLAAGESRIALGCDLVRLSGGAVFTFKLADEMGDAECPSYYGCPRRVLDRLTGKCHPIVANWRARVLTYQATRRVVELSAEQALAA